ncbi:phage tail tube protein [Deinococcus sp. YIM 77859]|uniref:beta strand repeat-containing protein n=1 Tax=Deinococcus sp. YIM 77859 TaxID=1540221 RepID=UPI0005548E65|nr:phage tail tube protein [Deinococcus sp. YIM 77859]
MNKNIALLALTGVLTLASCSGGPNVTTPPETQNPVTTGSLTIVKPDTVTAVVRNSAGTDVAPSSYSALAPGNYTVTFSREGYVSQTANFTIVAGQNTQVTAPNLTQNPSTTPSRGVYYIGANGALTAIPAADLEALRNGDASRFVFNAWLEDEAGGVTVSDANAISGTPSAGEQIEVAPDRTQNLAVAYVGYRAADGNVYPVAGATVRWNITGAPDYAELFEDVDEGDELTPEQQAALAAFLAGSEGAVIFGAADDGGNDTGFTGGITPPSVAQPLSISANAKQADTITNYVGGSNLPFPASNNTYPLNNATGVTSANVNGLTWTTLFANRDYAAAEVVAVAFIDGIEIDKAVLNKYFAPRPELTIDKRIVTDSDGDNNGVVSVTGGTVTLDIEVRNNGGIATDIDVSDLLNLGNADDYAIVGGTVQVLDENGTVVDSIPVAEGADGFDYTIDELDEGEARIFRFTVDADAPGAYCDTGVITSYNSPFFGAFDNVNLADEACAIFTAPQFTITKTFANGATTAVASAGQSVPVTITVRNNGNATGTFDGVSEFLSRVNGAPVPPTTNDPNYSVSNPSAGGVVTGDSITWDPATPIILAPGDSQTFTFNVQASADGQYCDVATTGEVSFGTAPTSNEACLVVVTPTITKTNNPRVLRPGQGYTSTITVRNPSTYTPITVNVNDTLGFNNSNNGYVTFSGATYSVNGNPAVAVTSANNAVSTGNVTIPANGTLVLTVNSTIPLGAGGTYCNVATFVPTFNPNFTPNSARDCVFVQTNVALQTQLTDTVDPITRNNGANADGRTTYVSVLSNEVASNETVGNSTISYAFGAQTGVVDGDPSGDGSVNPGDGLFNNPTATRVYFDPTPQRDPVTGAVVSDYNNATAVQLNQGADYTITSNAGGEQVLNITRALPPGAAFFVVHENVSVSPAVPTTNPNTGNNLYSTNYVWVTRGVASGTTYSATSAEPTSVR